MPITREARFVYPIDWPELSRLIRFGRAGGCCGRPHGRTVIHLGDGTWWDADRERWHDGRSRRVRDVPPPNVIEARQPCLAGLGLVAGLSVTRVVLASCHLGHEPSRNCPRDLAALCQRCRMLHDAPKHRRTRWRRAHGGQSRGARQAICLGQAAERQGCDGTENGPGQSLAAANFGTGVQSSHHSLPERIEVVGFV